MVQQILGGIKDVYASLMFLENFYSKSVAEVFEPISFFSSLIDQQTLKIQD